MLIRYLRISDHLKLVDYKAEETVNNLISSFTEEKRGRKNINSRYNCIIDVFISSALNKAVKRVYMFNMNDYNSRYTNSLIQCRAVVLLLSLATLIFSSTIVIVTYMR